MSQATDSTTTIPTRRAFLLRSAPVAAAVVMVGGATAVEAAVPAVAAPEPIPAASLVVDPIFALIKRHRAALREAKRTHDIFEQFAAEHPYEDDNNRGVAVGERPVRSVEVARKDEEAIHLNYPLTGKTEPIIVWNEKGLVHYVPTGLSEAERTAWIKEKTKELRRNRRAYARRNKNPQRDGAYDAWNEASIVVDGLSKQIIETAPTTVAGIAAVLAHWSGVMSKEDHDRDFISTTEFLESLAEGVKAIG